MTPRGASGKGKLTLRAGGGEKDGERSTDIVSTWIARLLQQNIIVIFRSSEIARLWEMALYILTFGSDGP